MSFPRFLLFLLLVIPQFLISQDVACGWTVATCHAFFTNEPVGVMYDVTQNSTAPLGDDWVPTIPGEIHPTNWYPDTVGQVFGTAWDANANVYLAATDVYKFDAGYLNSYVGIAGHAGIYKASGIDGYLAHPFVTTMASASFNTIGTNQIPNTGGLGNGIGNIAYDATFDQFFATNMEDGRIYRIDNSGIVQAIYDPYNIDTGSAGMVTPASEQVWGIGVYSQGGSVKIFFARHGKEIWSIPLTGAGEFDNTGGTVTGGIMNGSSVEQLEKLVAEGMMLKLTDLAFSEAGNMLVAERSNPHNSGVYEYTFDGVNWNYLRTYYTGRTIAGLNSAGGVDYGYEEINGNPQAECDGIVWASANYNRPVGLMGLYSYGLQGMDAMTGNAPYPSNAMTDIFLDFDGTYNTSDKNQLGDVEILKCGCPQTGMVNCDSLMVMPRSNNIDPTVNTCCWSIDLKNNVGDNITKVCVDINTPDWIFNTGSLVLGGGYTWETNTSTQICFEHPGAIPSGMLNNVLEFCLIETDPAASLPQEVIFSWFEGPQQVVCADTLYFDCTPMIVEDPCVTFDQFEVLCIQGNDSEYCVSFDVTNNSSFAAYSLILENLAPGYSFADCGCGGLPYGVGMLDYAFDWFLTPLAAGATRSVCVKIIAGSPILSPTDLCINGSLEGLTECCSSPADYCFRLNPCCDPCEATSINVKEIAGDECCYSITPNFGCTFDYFTKIEFDIITPDVVFGSHFIGDPANWNVCGTPTLTNVCLEPLTPVIFSGVYPDLFNFCLTEIASGAIPQELNIKYWTLDANGMDSVACDTTLFFDCPATEIPCSFVTNEEITCLPDSSKYLITVDVQNISNPDFTAEFLAFLPLTGLSPNPVPLIPPLPNDGSMRTVSFCYTPATFPDPDNELVLVYRLKDTEGDSCCNGNTMIFDTLSLPDCINCEPELRCPDDIVVDCCGIVQLPDPVLTDSCGGHIVNCMRADGLPLSDPFPMGVTTINCSGTDANGDVITCSYTVTVLDSIPPSFPCPPDLTIMGDADCQGTIPDFITELQVTENCGGYTATQSMEPGIMVGEGTYMITITVIDDCGNESNCVVTMTVDCGQQECPCGTYNRLELINPDGSAVDVTCGTGVAYELGCPVADRSLYFEYTCPDQACPWNRRVQWELSNSGGLINDGFVNTGASPGASIPLSALDFAGTGNYTLQLTTMCGDQECVCTIEFYHECEKEDCTCDDFESDFYTDIPNSWDPNGMGYPDINVWTSGCKVFMEPNEMGPCDKISWEFTNVDLGTTVSPTTIGNDVVSFAFISGQLYEIIITVTRTLPDGTQCEEIQYKTNRRFKCQPQIAVECNPAILDNEDFELSADGWTVFTGIPNYVDNGGSDGNGYVELSGSNLTQDGIASPLVLPTEPNQQYRISFDVLNKRAMPNTRLVVNTYEALPTGINCETDCILLGEIIFDNEADAVWKNIEAFASGTMLNYISFHVENRFPDNGDINSRSIIGLDAICIEAVTDTTLSVHSFFSQTSFTLFPNPATDILTIENRTISSDYLNIQILDLMGRPVHQEKISGREKFVPLKVRKLPAAVYLIKIQATDGSIWNSKFIKH